jgi:hypothetical protein
MFAWKNLPRETVVSNKVMRMRWRLVLPSAGLFLFALLSLGALQRNHPPGRNKLASTCMDGGRSCSEWDLKSMTPIVDAGMLERILIPAAMPAFLLGRLMVRALSRIGVSEVYSFMISMPLLIAALFYVVGSLIDKWKRKPSP